MPPPGQASAVIRSSVGVAAMTRESAQRPSGYDPLPGIQRERRQPGAMRSGQEARRAVRVTVCSGDDRRQEPRKTHGP